MNVLGFVTMFLCVSVCFATNCTLSSHIKGDAKKTAEVLLNRLAPLKGKVFTAVDDSGDTTYSYNATICTPLKANSSIVQTDLNNKNTKVVGRLNDTSVIGGDTWILLSYGSGDNYTSEDHCQKEARHGHIMIICDYSVSKPTLKMLEENREKDERCYYLFELSTDVICPNDEDRGLGPWGVFFVIIVLLVFIYCIVGTLYRRIVKDRRGIAQLPHYRCWMVLGYKSADWCDYMCRCNPNRESEYSNVGIVVPAPVEEDDQLLRP